MIQIVLVAGVWLAFGGSVAAAQMPPPGAVPQQAPQLDQPPLDQTPPGIEAPTPAQVYSYQSAGRRDPFLSLVGRGLEAGSGERPGGLQGWASTR